LLPDDSLLEMLFDGQPLSFATERQTQERELAVNGSAMQCLVQDTPTPVTVNFKRR
jgi:hypothetical protein